MKQSGTDPAIGPFFVCSVYSVVKSSSRRICRALDFSVAISL